MKYSISIYASGNHGDYTELVDGMSVNSLAGALKVVDRIHQGKRQPRRYYDEASKCNRLTFYPEFMVTLESVIDDEIETIKCVFADNYELGQP